MKTMKLFKWLIPLILFTFISGCQKDIEEEYWLYLGFWGSEKFILEIWQSGEARFAKIGKYDYSGWVKIKERKIVFHAWDDRFTKRLTINREPSIDEFGLIYMVLDRKRFTKH